MANSKLNLLILSPWSNEWDENIPNPTNRIVFKYLVNSGFELNVIQPGPCSRIPSPNLKCYSLGMRPELKPGRISHLWSFLSYGYRFYVMGTKLLKFKKFDLIYGFSGKTAIPVYLLSKRFKVPSVLKLFGILYFSHGRKGLRDAFLNLEHYLGYKIPVDLLMVINDGTGGDRVAKNLKILHRFVFLPNPRPDWNPIKNAKRELGIPMDKKVILYVSRLDILKGVEILPNIMKTLKTKVPDILFLVIGDGPKRGYLLQKIKEFNIQDVVKYVGFVTHSKLARYYSASELFLAIAEYSNATLPVIEALSMGIPVIAFDTGHTKAVIPDGKGVVYVPYMDIDSLIQTAVSILNEPETRAKLSKNALEFSKTLSTWENVAKREAKILRTIATK